MALVGFMGAGKSTIGPLLADRRGWPFVDLDTEIAGRAGLTPGALIRTRGEVAFRELEREVLIEQLRRKHPLVLATGGGVVEEPANLRDLKEWGTVVFLDVPLEVLRRRVGDAPDRPIWGEAGLRFERREPLYRQAHVCVSAVGTPESVLESLCEVLAW